jgi:hypothetical protein
VNAANIAATLTDAHRAHVALILNRRHRKPHCHRSSRGLPPPVTEVTSIVFPTHEEGHGAASPATVAREVCLRHEQYRTP